MKRLLLFDIDGTLVEGGPAKDAFRVAMVETFGTAGDIAVHDFAGKTDPQIARELLHDAGLADEAIGRGFPELWRRYVGYLRERLAVRPMRLLPGVRPLLEALRGRDDVALGLLTGNIVDGARLKLASVGLLEHFDGIGGFGSDSEERNDLPAIAMTRARRTWGAPFAPPDVVVVGDTPRDVDCGRRVGMRTFGVATGRYPAAALEAAGADHVAEDLRDTRGVVRVLTGGDD